MKLKENETPVIFRKYSDGEVIALFPSLPGRVDRILECESYMHVGQHGAAWYDLVIQDTKPANYEEFKELFEELTSIGYDLRIYRRSNFLFYEMRRNLLIQ